MFATCEAGDEIVVFEPFYTNYNSYAMFINHARSGFDNRSQRISPADGYEIEKKITGKTKAVLIHTEYRHRLFKGRDGDAGYPRQKHGHFMSDEVYREYAYDGKAHRFRICRDFRWRLCWIVFPNDTAPAGLGSAHWCRSIPYYMHRIGQGRLPPV